ncbi:hypothetical protein Dfer_3507 [Dyadobacter fermentans DSM 18053]|uniref:Uncharacterized protein n=1 Tax=Dyadobacter fermentans (strain ATCC 700827 / DSM 18053 / CIP 107007 / KCTC 52180 / NS114) TaxID=471854 RepID=C6VTU8_DYAFD|nr:hypothetical protein Dfer_3507 [Dyadobacter fermentans DSM 18053]
MQEATLWPHLNRTIYPKLFHKKAGYSVWNNPLSPVCKIKS